MPDDLPGSLETTSLWWQIVWVHEKICCSKKGWSKTNFKCVIPLAHSLKYPGLLQKSHCSSMISFSLHLRIFIKSCSVNAFTLCSLFTFTEPLSLCDGIKAQTALCYVSTAAPLPSSSWEPHSRLHGLWIIKFHGLAWESSAGQIWIIDRDWMCTVSVHVQPLSVEPLL